MFTTLPVAPPPFTPDEHRRIFGLLPTGVVAITGVTAEDKPMGFIVGTFQSLSLDPALVTFSIAKTSTTWPVLRRHGSFTANILSTDQSPVCKALGRKGEDKFEGIDHEPSAIGTPRLRDAVAWIDCQVLSEVVAGDHFVIVGAISSMAVGNGQPLIFSGGAFGGYAPLVQPDPVAQEVAAADLVPRIADAWNRAWGHGDTAAYEQVVSAKYVRHLKNGEDARLREVLRQIEESYAAFSDFDVVILHAVSQGDLLALHWRTTATHTGIFMDVPPTNRRVTVTGASFMRHEDGRIVEEWVAWEPRELLASMQIWHLGGQAARAV